VRKRQAGHYDRQAQFQRRTVTQTGLGSEDTWANIGPAYWCKVADVTTTEVDGAGQVQSDIATLFFVRLDSFTATIMPGDRAIYEGRTYTINGRREVGDARLRELEFRAAARNDL
jgi:head-tail adaptor